MRRAALIATVIFLAVCGTLPTSQQYITDASRDGADEGPLRSRAAVAFPGAAFADTADEEIPRMEPLNRFPRMMQEYLVRRLDAVYEANQQRVMSLQSREDALAYRAEVREKMPLIFGEMPERTPLNVRVTGEVDRGAYIVRNIIFDSRPDFPVTANLYIPRGHEGPRPGVLCLCGHAGNAKSYELYQPFAQALARMGYITLIFDPIGQAERLQYHDGEGDSLVGNGVREHNFMARQQLLVGEFIGTWFAWDGIRALDVLLEQEGIDPERIGVTGNSGGGNMTAYAVALDDRITMSVPSCWITSWRHNGVNEEPIDAEQCALNALGLGVEQSDLMVVQAPEPALMITQEQDFFDQRGSLEAAERLRHIYRLLGAEDAFGYHVGPNVHGFWQDAREAMYEFFNEHAGVDAPSEEPEMIIEDDETLQCTETGQVDDMGAKSVSDFTREKSLALAEQRGEPAGAELRRRVSALLDLPERDGPPEYRVLRPWTRRGYARERANQFVLETEPQFGAQAVVTKLEDEYRTARPLPGDGPALLYLPHISSDQELREDQRLRAMQGENEAFFACDYRGIGESRPDTCRPDMFFHLYGSDYHYASYALILGESYVAWRVHDVLCTLDWMASLGYDEVHLVARGWGAIPGALAALLDDRVERVTLINAPRSYSELAETKMQQWPLSAMLPHVLEQFDLPDVYRELEAKSLQQIEPWSAMMEPAEGAN
ncbi:MAG: alpha/beta hydrolase [Armatimonadota bacterium]|jgi:pimeloyl-ACP methyl ester carboxylesterase